MSFKTNSVVVNGLVDTKLTAAVGTTVQAYDAKLAGIAALNLSGNGSKALVVNAAGSAIEFSSALGTAAYATLGTAVGNVPVLGTGGKLDANILPAMDVVDVFTVADLTARDALVATKGDVAVVSSLSKTYIYSGSAWVEMISPSSTGSVTSVAGKTGVVTLALSDLTDVTTTGHAAGHVLRFDGSKYVSAVLSYADLSNLPTLFSGSYADLTNKPVLFSGAYADLTGKPTLGTAAAKDISFFAAAVHTHVAADITDLNTVVDGKISTAIAAIPAPDTSKVSVSTISVDTTLAASAHVVLVTAAATVTLPSPVNGKTITVKNATSNASVTVASAATIDGAASVVISNAYESVTVVSNGTAWFVI
jgi:hypothetical protein